MSAELVTNGRPEVRVLLLLVRGHDVLLSEPPEPAASSEAEGAPAASGIPRALPQTLLGPAEPILGCADRIAQSLGIAALENVVFAHLGNVARSDGGHELRIGLAAWLPEGAAVPDGFALHSAANPPELLEESTRAVFDACKSGESVIDTGGRPITVAPFPEPRRRPAGADAVAAVEPPPLPAASGPTALSAGIWFGGALLWVSSVLLVFDDLRAFQGMEGVIAWLFGAGVAWYACTSVGADLRPANARVAPRAAAVLGTGLALLAAAAVVIGLIGLPSQARSAYALLGFLGIVLFFVGQWRSRRRMPRATPQTGALVLLAEGLTVLFTLGLLLAR